MVKTIAIKQLNDFLKKIGLSRYKREVYLSLINLKEASVDEINKKVSVPLPKIYETLNELSDLGLIKLVSTKPKCYEVTCPKDYFNKVIESKKSELAALEKEKKKFLELFNKTKKPPSNIIEIITGQANVYSFLCKKAKLYSKSYDAILTLRNIPDPLFPILKRKIKTGFKVRIVVPTGREKNAKEYKKIGAKIRLSDKLSIHSRFSIWDKKFLILTLPDVKTIYTTLAVNSPTLINYYYRLFIQYWNSAKDLC